MYVAVLQAAQLLSAYSSNASVPVPPETAINSSNTNTSTPVAFYALSLHANGTQVRACIMAEPAGCPCLLLQAYTAVRCRVHAAVTER